MTYSELSILLLHFHSYELVFDYRNKWDVNQRYEDGKFLILGRCNHFKEAVQFLQWTNKVS